MARHPLKRHFAHDLKQSSRERVVHTGPKWRYKASLTQESATESSATLYPELKLVVIFTSKLGQKVKVFEQIGLTKF